MDEVHVTPSGMGVARTGGMMPGILDRTAGWFRRYTVEWTLVLIGVLFLVAYFAKSIFIVIPAGHAGVLFHTLFGGTELSGSYGEGLKVIFPLNRMTVYDLRLKRYHATFDGISRDGLSIQLALSVRYHINAAVVAHLHQEVGPNYEETLVRPEVGAAIRIVVGRYLPEQLYAANRRAVQDEVLAELDSRRRKTLATEAAEGQPFLEFDDVLVESIVLPEIVTMAIQKKLAALHDAEAFRYRIDLERREAERKEIEAQGIKAFQDTVSNSLTDRYLRWKGIEATLNLAQSNNSKVVIVGSGEGGLPLILGNLDGPATGSPTGTNRPNDPLSVLKSPTAEPPPAP